jgi:phage terminase small subunit
MFVKEYLIDLNATRAAKSAGYSEKTAKAVGCENLTKPDIASAIQLAMEDRSRRVEITSDYVLDTIRETIERCRQAQPVYGKKGEHIRIKNANGELVPAYVFDSNAVLKGCDLLGKNLALWKDVGSKDNPLTYVPVQVVFGREDEA